MKKLTFVLVCLGLLNAGAVYSAAKPAVKKTSTTTTKKPPVGTTKGANSIHMGSAEETQSSAGHLSVTTGALPSSSASGASSATPQIANGYAVMPRDTNPAYLYSGAQKGQISLLGFMEGLASAGYTTLVNGKQKPLIDKSLAQQRLRTFGKYSKNSFVPASKAKKIHLTQPQANLSSSLTRGVYKINQEALLQAIQEGKFSSDLLTSRLLIQEFFLGRLAVTVQALAGGNALGKDQGIIKTLSSKVSNALRQTRYIRCGLQSTTEHRFVGTVGKGKMFSPVDFFVGAIIVNKSKVAIQSGEEYIYGGGVGFLPIPSSTYMNNWSNKSTSNYQGLPTYKPMRLGELGGRSGSIALTPSQDQRTLTIQFEGKVYTPDSFDRNGMHNFFEDLSPWAVIVEIPSEGAPSIIGLAKMGMGDFAQYLNIDAAVPFEGGEPGKAPSPYTLGNVIDAPYDIYKSTYAKSKTGSGTRYVTSNYSVGDWVSQGMLNGMLELSSHQALAYPVVTPAKYKPGKYNKKTRQYAQVLVSPSKVHYTMFKPQPVALTKARNQDPDAVSIFGYNSGIDWLFLRALRITKAVLTLSGISEKLLNAADQQGQPLFFKVLQNPTQPIVVHNASDFSQGGSSPSTGSATQVSGAGMLQGFGGSSVNTNKKVTKKAPSKKQTAQKSQNPIIKGDVLYVPQTRYYTPLVLTLEAERAYGARQQMGNTPEQPGGYRNRSTMQLHANNTRRGTQQSYGYQQRRRRRSFRRMRLPKRQQSFMQNPMNNQMNHQDGTFSNQNTQTILPSSSQSMGNTSPMSNQMNQNMGGGQQGGWDAQQENQPLVHQTNQQRSMQTGWNADANQQPMNNLSQG